MKRNGTWASIFMLGVMGFGANCGGDSGNSKVEKGSDECSTPGTSSPSLACGNPAIAAPVCSSPLPTPYIDLSGMWVLETIGAQVVQAPGYNQPFHIKSISTALVQVTHTGSAVTFDGQYCDRIQRDDPNNPAQVQVLDAWRLTPTPLRRTGTFSPDANLLNTLSMPAVVEIFGARLADPACDSLPLDANDPRLVDDDQDGYPGISIGLQKLVVGSLHAVQRQVTALTGFAVTSERIEGSMAYGSDQTVVASDPANIRCLYRSSKSFADPDPCSSHFVMVKVSPSAGAVDCAWVRNNQATLLGL